MALTKNPDCRNAECRLSASPKVSFDLKLSIIDQIVNRQISLNHAVKVYNRSAFRISRSSITYWMNELRSFKQKTKGMSKNAELKKLRERREAPRIYQGTPKGYYCRIGGFHSGGILKSRTPPEVLPKAKAHKKNNHQHKFYRKPKPQKPET